jgi:hypothetical protein
MLHYSQMWLSSSSRAHCALYFLVYFSYSLLSIIFTVHCLLLPSSG